MRRRRVRMISQRHSQDRVVGLFHIQSRRLALTRGRAQDGNPYGCDLRQSIARVTHTGSVTAMVVSAVHVLIAVRGSNRRDNMLAMAAAEGMHGQQPGHEGHQQEQPADDVPAQVRQRSKPGAWAPTSSFPHHGHQLKTRGTRPGAQSSDAVRTRLDGRPRYLLDRPQTALRAARPGMAYFPYHS